jgi:hypothetical protein
MFGRKRTLDSQDAIDGCFNVGAGAITSQLHILLYVLGRTSGECFFDLQERSVGAIKEHLSSKMVQLLLDDVLTSLHCAVMI